MHTTYEISPSAEAQYRGCGIALVAIADGKAVAISYASGLLPEMELEDLEDALGSADDARVRDAAARLAAEGDVVAAMCSGWEVVELWAVRPRSAVGLSDLAIAGSA